MVFIPRDPVMQNQFLAHDSAQGSTATAGSVVYLSGDELVAVVTGTNTAPYGFLMQSVKAESSAHPTGFRLPGDLGSSDAFTGDPVGVAHLGTYDTTHYNTATTYTAGAYLGVMSDGSGKLTVLGTTSIAFGAHTNSLDLPSADVVAIAQNTLATAAVAAGQKLRVKLLI
jgi:hypothetical protein